LAEIVLSHKFSHSCKWTKIYEQNWFCKQKQCKLRKLKKKTTRDQELSSCDKNTRPVAIFVERQRSDKSAAKKTVLSDMIFAKKAHFYYSAATTIQSFDKNNL
jgi:hypothetical protein